MSISKYPSKVCLPQQDPGYGTVLAFLIAKFPAVSASTWRDRIEKNKVHWQDGSLISCQTRFRSQANVYYYREVEVEPLIPFTEHILYQDQHILVAYKPHFLPVTPGGIYVNECLQNRLRNKTKLDQLQALHRLDRETAGLVLFSVNPDSRAAYHQLFADRQISKKYQAIASIHDQQRIIGQQWTVKNRLVKSNPRFLMAIVAGQDNSHSEICCIKQKADKALFELEPITGRTHQLRLHMQSLGWPIQNDRFYPELQPKTEDDYAQPLQLLAKELQFMDPITQQPRYFSCQENLCL